MQQHGLRRSEEGSRSRADLPEEAEKNRGRRDERESPNPVHRDLSIRYPGMTTQSFDEFVELLDEVVYEGSADLPEEEERGAQHHHQSEPVLIPRSPPHVGVEPIVPSLPSEIQFNSRVGAWKTAIRRCAAV